MEWLIVPLTAGLTLLSLDVIRRMSPQTWHPYRWAMIAVCVGAFARSCVGLLPPDCLALAPEGWAQLCIYAGVLALILCERRTRPQWGTR
jgi:hypothetical protein